MADTDGEAVGEGADGNQQAMNLKADVDNSMIAAHKLLERGRMARPFAFAVTIMCSCAMLSSCGTVQLISEQDRATAKTVRLVVSLRRPPIDLVCNGLACAGLVATRGIAGQSSGPLAANLATDQTVRERLSREFEAEVGDLTVWTRRLTRTAIVNAGFAVASESELPFVAFPSASDLTPKDIGVEQSTILHVQYWTFGIGRDAASGFRPTISAKATLLSASSGRVLWSQFFALGPDAGGKSIRISDTLPEYATLDEVARHRAAMAKGIKDAVDALMRQVARDTLPR